MLIFNDMKKETIKILKPFVRVGAFVLAFVLVCYAVSQVFFSNIKATRYGNSFSMAYSYTEDPENSLQIAGVGNSDLMSAFVPTQLWQDYGYTSTLLSAGKMKPYRAYTMLTELLKVQSPDLIIVEVDMLYEGSSLSKKSDDDSIRAKLDDFFASVLPEYFETKVENKFTVFRYHDRWKNIGSNKKENATPSSHGYKYCAEIQPVHLDNFMRPDKKSEPIPDDSLENLEKIFELCNKNDIDVMLLEMPSGTSWNYQRHNAVAKYASNKGVRFLDMNTCIDEYNLDFKKDFRDYDANHLNYYGALKVTDYIGRFIDENYNVENRFQNPDYDYWNDYCTKFKKEIMGADS